MKKFFIWAGGLFVLLVVIAAIAGGGSDTNTNTANTSTETSTQNKDSGTTESSKPKLTPGQKNALQSAEDYLDTGSFSKQGLYRQLHSAAGEGFSKADATYAVNHAGADWNKEAVESARSYLDNGSFSRSGLMEQLTSSAGEGFTQAQARYAVDKVYR